MNTWYLFQIYRFVFGFFLHFLKQSNHLEKCKYAYILPDAAIVAFFFNTGTFKFLLFWRHILILDSNHFHMPYDCIRRV